MTPTTWRGRGRPIVFDQALQTAYLAHIAAGTRLGDAATLIGISINVPRNHARTNPAFAQKLAAARAAGRKARANQRPHGETHYNHDHCRHPDCRTAAREGRAKRRHQQDETEQNTRAVVVDLPAPHPGPDPCVLLPCAS